MLKIDPHLHLGGVVPIEFVWETIQNYGLKHLAETKEEVRCQMTFCEGEKRTFHRFLDKFRILDEIVWTPQIIDNSIRAVSNYLAAQKIDYAWMSFSINKYMKIGWHKHEVIKFIAEAFQRYRPGGVGLILSLKYESMVASQRQYAKLIENELVAKHLIGLDLVGDESHFDADFYAPLFRDWNAAGKITRAHVGESQGKENIREALLKLNLTNVAHGFKIIHDPQTVAIAKDRGVTFDLAITSNDITGVWPLNQTHPGVVMLGIGLKCTLGSDDPVQCSTSLDREFEIAPSVGFTEANLLQMRHIAEQNSLRFISPD
jgi:adenosine deaminase